MRASPASRVFSDMASIVLTCFAVLTVVFVAALFVLPRTGTGRALSVLTGSMAPVIPEGSLILIRPVDPQTISAGDVVTFRPRSNSDALVTHRVVGVVPGTTPTLSFRTKGDANSGEDPNLVSADAIAGKVVYQVPRVGHIAAWAHSGSGLVGLAALPLLLYLGSALRRGARRPAIANASVNRGN
jgi:signal peptidase